MRGTAELTCGHWIVYLDTEDTPPDRGPWSLAPSMQIAVGMPASCLVCLSTRTIRTWLPGKWLNLNDGGH